MCIRDRNGWPVVDVASVVFSPTQDWLDPDALLSTPSEYNWTSEGRVLFSECVPIDVLQGLRVTYRAGLVDTIAELSDVDTDGVGSSPYHYLAVACAMQALQILERRDNLDGTTEIQGAASIGFQRPVQLSRVVVAMLRPLRSMAVA